MYGDLDKYFVDGTCPSNGYCQRSDLVVLYPAPPRPQLRGTVRDIIILHIVILHHGSLYQRRTLWYATRSGSSATRHIHLEDAIAKSGLLQCRARAHILSLRAGKITCKKSEKVSRHPRRNKCAKNSVSEKGSDESDFGNRLVSTMTLPFLRDEYRSVNSTGAARTRRGASQT